MIRAKCPASCGELFQGYIDGKNLLISYPIDLFSIVTIKEGKSNEMLYPKAYNAIKKSLKYFGYDQNEYKNIALDIDSNIPIGKGMASSTADLAATILATSRYLNREIDNQQISDIAIEIEPTDSTIFEKLTLYDYLKGRYKKLYENKLDLKVLCIEGKGTIDTVKFNKLNLYYEKIKYELEYRKSLSLVEKGLQENDMHKLAKGSTLSAFINQKYLFKEDLENIYNLAIKCNAYGINTSHSGTVTGILYDEKYFDKEKFLYEIKNIINFNKYERVQEYNIIKGGPSLF